MRAAAGGNGPPGRRRRAGACGHTHAKEGVGGRAGRWCRRCGARACRMMLCSREGGQAVRTAGRQDVRPHRLVTHVRQASSACVPQAGLRARVPQLVPRCVGPRHAIWDAPPAQRRHNATARAACDLLCTTFTPPTQTSLRPPYTLPAPTSTRARLRARTHTRTHRPLVTPAHTRAHADTRPRAPVGTYLPAQYVGRVVVELDAVLDHGPAVDVAHKAAALLAEGGEQRAAPSKQAPGGAPGSDTAAGGRGAERRPAGGEGSTVMHRTGLKVDVCTAKGPLNDSCPVLTLPPPPGPAAAPPNRSPPQQVQPADLLAKGQAHQARQLLLLPGFQGFRVSSFGVLGAPGQARRTRAARARERLPPRCSLSRRRA